MTFAKGTRPTRFLIQTNRLFLSTDQRFKVVLVNRSGSKVSDIQNWSLGTRGTKF